MTFCHESVLLIYAIWGWTTKKTHSAICALAVKNSQPKVQEMKVGHHFSTCDSCIWGTHWNVDQTETRSLHIWLTVTACPVRAAFGVSDYWFRPVHDSRVLTTLMVATSACEHINPDQTLTEKAWYFRETQSLGILSCTWQWTMLDVFWQDGFRKGKYFLVEVFRL